MTSNMGLERIPKQESAHKVEIGNKIIPLLGTAETQTAQSAKDAEIIWDPHGIPIFLRAPDTHMGSFRILYSFPT